MAKVMGSHEIVTTLVSALHSNIDSIHAALQSLSSHPTHEAELQRLAAEREAKIFDLRTAHAQALQVLANQRLKEQDELEAQRQKEVEELEQRRKREWEEVLKRRAKEDEEREERIRQEELDRERVKQEEDERREAQREERELELAEDIEKELERVEDEIEARVEAGKKALKELDEKRRAINAEIDKALSMPTMIPKIPYRSRSRTLSRAGTMELPTSPQSHIGGSVYPAADKEIQRSEPAAWLGKDTEESLERTGRLADAGDSKFADTSIPKPKVISRSVFEHENESPASVDSGVELNDDHIISPTTKDISLPLDSPNSTSSQVDDQNTQETSSFAQLQLNGHKSPSLEALTSRSSDERLSDLQPHDTPESGSTCQSTQMTPVASSDDLIRKELESQRMMLPVTDASKDLTDAQPSRQTFENKAIHDPMADLLWGRTSPTPGATKNQPKSFTSNIMKPVSDPMGDILWGRTLPKTSARKSVSFFQPATQTSSDKRNNDPMFDILWERSTIPQSNAVEIRKCQEIVTEERSRNLTDPMFDILWERAQAPRSSKAESRKCQNPTVVKLSGNLNDPMFDVLWERTQPPPSGAVETRKVHDTAANQASRKFTDPMSDYLWGRRQIPGCDTTDAPKNKTTPAKDVSRATVQDPMFDILWGRSRVLQSEMVRTMKIQQAPLKSATETIISDPMFDVLWERNRVSPASRFQNCQPLPSPETSTKIIHDPMSDILWGRTKSIRASEAPNSQQTSVPVTASKAISDPMFEILWQRGQKPLDKTYKASEPQQTPIAMNIREDSMFDTLWGHGGSSRIDILSSRKSDAIKQIYDPMSDFLWGRSTTSRASPQNTQSQQKPVMRETKHDPMSDILWGRSVVSQSSFSKAGQHERTPVKDIINHDPKFDILWERTAVSRSASSINIQQKQNNTIELMRDPMADVLWGRAPISQSSFGEIREPSIPLSLAAESMPEALEHQQTLAPQLTHDPMSDILWGRIHISPRAALEDDRIEDEANVTSHKEGLADTGRWPHATRRDLIIDHGEDNLSTSSVDESQLILGQATSSQLHVDEAYHVLSPDNSSNHPEPHQSVKSSSQTNGFAGNEADLHHESPARHRKAEPWPLRDENQATTLNAHDSIDHDESEDISEGSDDWSENDEEEASEPEQGFGSLRPQEINRTIIEDEYLPESASNIAATDSEDDLTFEEKYGIPRPSSPIRSLSRIEKYFESQEGGSDASDDDEDSEDESFMRHVKRSSYSDDLADQYYPRADTPLEIVPEHAPLTEFNDTYSSHRSSGLFTNIVDPVRSDISAVRQVQLDNRQPRVEYELGNATRPRAVSFEDDDSDFVQESAVYERSLHVRTHAAETVPPFDSYAQSDSVPTTPSETSSGAFDDQTHSEPRIRDYGRERGMTETSQTAHELALDTAKAEAFDPTLTTAYPSFMSPKPSFADPRENSQTQSDLDRMNAGYGSFGAQTGLEAHRAEISPIRNTGINPLGNGLKTSQTPNMANNNSSKVSPMNQNSPGSGSSRTPTAEGGSQTTRSLPRTPPRLSLSPQSSSSPAGLKGASSPSPGLSKRPLVPTGSPGSLFAKTRSVFESASPQGSPALTPSPITALSAIRHSSPPLPPASRRSVGSRPSSLYISEPVQYSPPAEKEPEQANRQDSKENLHVDEEAFMPRSLDGNNKPPSPVFIPPRSASVSVRNRG